MNEQLIINDVTQLNPVAVWAIATPTTIEEVQAAIKRTTGAISIGGGRFSMGGQTASPDSLHLDLRQMNKVLAFAPTERTICVQPGIRWCDLQKFIDPHDLAIKIMQTYANFTVGGSLSVNVHGRYIGLGPLILSVRAIKIVLADGSVQTASPTVNSEIFYGAIGGYGALGVIVEAELELTENTRVERTSKKLSVHDYLTFFRKEIRANTDVIFHNADIYPPHYAKVRCETWSKTNKPVTVPHRLQQHRRSYPLENYFLWAFTETPFGKWRREHIIDPLLFRKNKVHWRNYEAGYNVAALEPPSRKRRTYVLQEYFVPVARLAEFIPKIADVLQRHRVNALNISIRHALPDPGSLLAWAREETFAFVLYYKQRTRENAKNRVAVWTRELIDAVLSVGGTYYLPYQAHATAEQFHQSYPRAHELFALKRKLDPEYRWRNVLWDKYYAPTLTTLPTEKTMSSEFHTIFAATKSHDDFYAFLQNIFHLYPEDRFHTLIKEACAQQQNDEAIYRYIQKRLPSIKPFLSELTYALPALKKQKQEMTRQTLELLGNKHVVNGYAEIGTTGRYISDFRKHIQLKEPTYLIHDVPPTNSPIDIIERGGLSKIGTYISLNDYAPISAESIASNSLDLVTCYIGLHHIRPELLNNFMHSIWRVLRPGGLFILRDHDVTNPLMDTFVSLAHIVFNAGLGASWEANQQELKFFTSVVEWSRRLTAIGFTDTGARLRQANDPTDNLLMAFVKETKE